jgi:hypothetical protein
VLTEPHSVVGDVGRRILWTGLRKVTTLFGQWEEPIVQVKIPIKPDWNPATRIVRIVERKGMDERRCRVVDYANTYKK